MMAMVLGNDSDDHDHGGDGANLQHITDLSQEIFQQPIKIGQPQLTGGVSEKVNNTRYSTGVGLINYGTENWEELEYDNPININSIVKRSLNKMGNIFKNWY